MREMYLLLGILAGVSACTLGSRARTCPQPDKKPGSSFKPTQHVYYAGMEIIYSCDNGAIISEESNVRICLQTRVWSGHAPNCTTFPSDDAFVCTRPEDPENGQVLSTPEDQRHFTDGQSIRYVCDSGYRAEVPKGICIGGIWTFEPVCNRGTCPSLPPPLNGAYTQSQRSKKIWYIGEVARFECLEGFIAENHQVSLCQDSGWSREVPTCKPKIKCISRPPPQNGNYYQPQKKNWYAGDVARFRCQSAYQLRGSARATCLSTGKWSGALPTCQARNTCLSRPPPNNGAYDSVEKKTWRVGDRAIYRCDQTFQLVGSRTSRCLSPGRWSEKVPSCLVISRDVAASCERPKDPPHGKIHSVPFDKTEFTDGDTIELRCVFGYFPSDEEGIALCLSGKWTNTPRCISNDIRCQHREPPRDGGYIYAQRDKTSWSAGDIARFRCDNGYKLIGQEESSCDEDSSWSSPAPTCEPEQGRACSNRPPPRNGAYIASQLNKKVWKSGDLAQFVCSTGYLAMGPQIALCLASGKWSRKVPTCAAKPECEARPAPTHGHYKRKNKNVWYVGDVAFFECDVAYQLIGSATSTCQSNSEWSSEMPRCLGIFRDSPACSLPPEPEFGKIITFSSSPASEFHEGDHIQYICDTGFKFSSPKENGRVGCYNGQWSSIPHCIRS